MSRTWTMTAVTTGLLGCGCYFGSVVFKPLPWAVDRILFFAIGPLSVVAAVAFYRSIRHIRDGVLVQLGTVFLVLAGMLVNVMAVVQDSQFTTLIPRIRNAPDESLRAAREDVLWAVNTVQAGLDVAWDIHLLVGGTLLGMALIRTPGFGLRFGLVGAVASAAGLVLNLWTFPTAPAAAGLIDVGPLVGLWYAMILVRLWWLAHALPAANGTRRGQVQHGDTLNA